MAGVCEDFAKISHKGVFVLSGSLLMVLLFSKFSFG